MVYLPVLAVVMVWLAAMCGGGMMVKPAWVCGGEDELRVKSKFGKEFHWLCLREESIATSPLLAKTSFLLVDPFSKEKQALHASTIALVRGYTIGEAVVGNAEGYIGTDGEFVGALHYSKLLAKTSFLLVDPFSKEKQALHASTIALVRSYTIGEAVVGNAEGYIGTDGEFVGALHYSKLLAKTSFLLVDPFSKGKQALHASTIALVRGYTIGEAVVGNAEGYIGTDGEYVGALLYKNRTIYADEFDDPVDFKQRFGQFRHDLEPPPPLPSQRERKKRMDRGDMPPSSDPSNSSLEDQPVSVETETFNNASLSKRGSSVKSHQHGRRSPGATSHKPLPIYIFRRKPKAKQKKKPLISEFIIKPTEPPHLGARARLCELLLMADHAFFVRDANASLEQAVRRMFYAVSQADLIFRNTDFDDDGAPDNIGFAVKYVIVMTSAETDKRLFGDLPPRETQDARDYLMRFARLRRLGDVCLGVAFTGHAFKKGILGLSFSTLGTGKGAAAGGLCDRRAAGRSFNTLTVSHAARGGIERLPARLTAFTLAHEIGHSFGAHHDEEFPNQGCDSYLMSQGASPGNAVTHLQFSPCSRRRMRAAIESIGYCLAFDERPYCGNGVVEEGEACDCGLPWECAARDHCCTPRAGAAAGVVGDSSVHVEGCSVAPTALCHPSQGDCCDLNCRYLDLSEHGMDCSRMEDKCPCQGDQTRCRCGLGGECLPDGTCAAAECARLGLRECMCPHHGAGGAVAAAHRCGVCCVLPGDGTADNERCASAETAARQELAANRVSLEDLRDDDFSGPTVFFRMCPLRSGESCAYVSLRAWYPRGPCASFGELGTCSAHGVCEPRATRPRPHVYPRAARPPPPIVPVVKLMRQVNNIATMKNHIYGFVLSLYFCLLYQIQSNQ